MRHVFLLDGVVLEVDVVCWHGDERRSLAPPVFLCVEILGFLELIVWVFLCVLS